MTTTATTMKTAEEEEEEAAAAPPAAKPAAKPAKAAPAAADGDRSLEATIFVRGVPLSCDEPELHDAFQRYGKLQYCRVVRDPATGLSRGSAFVCYNAVGHAQLALAAASGGRGPTIHGQPLTLSAATSRQGAAELARSRQEGHGKGESKRNLHLARLGLAQAGDAAAEGMPRAELQKREGRGHRTEAREPQLCGVVDAALRAQPAAVDEKALAAAALAACATARKKLASLASSRRSWCATRSGATARAAAMRGPSSSLIATSTRSPRSSASATTPTPRDHGAKGRWLIVEFAVDNVQKFRLTNSAASARRSRRAPTGRPRRRKAAAADGAGGDGEADGGGDKAAAAAATPDQEAPRRGEGGGGGGPPKPACGGGAGGGRARPRPEAARARARGAEAEEEADGRQGAEAREERTTSGWCSNTARRSRGPPRPWRK